MLNKYLLGRLEFDLLRISVLGYRVLSELSVRERSLLSRHQAVGKPDLRSHVRLPSKGTGEPLQGLEQGSSRFVL